MHWDFEISGFSENFIGNSGMLRNPNAITKKIKSSKMKSRQQS
jgi:hypothetical protein